MKRLELLRQGMHRNVLYLIGAMFFLQAAFGTSDRFKTLYIESLGAKPALVGTVLGAAEAIRLCFLLASGPLSDRISPGIMIKMRWLAVGSAAVFLFATQWWMLFPAFALQAGANLAWPSVSRVIDESGPEEDRQHRFLMVYTIAPSIALLFAPLVGGELAERYGLRSVFVVLTIGLTISGIFFSLVKPASGPARQASGGYLDLLKRYPLNLLYLLLLLMMFFPWLGLLLAPNYLHNEENVSLKLIGAVGALVAVGSIAAAALLTRRPKVGKNLNGTILLMGMAPLIYVFLLGSSSAVSIGIAYALSGAAAVAQNTFYTPISDASPIAWRTRAFALIEVTGCLGIMLAGFASGALYEVRPALPMEVALIGTTLSLLLAVLVRRIFLSWMANEHPAAGPAAVTAAEA